MKYELTFIFVLKSGGDYTPAHVDILMKSMHEELKGLHVRNIVLTDYPKRHFPKSHEPLIHNWPGWWSKIEMFRFPGPAFYIDLDTILRPGWLDVLRKAEGKDFVILRDFYRGAVDPEAMQSSILYWGGDVSYLYTKFAKNPINLPGGDQIYLESNLREDVTYWQDITSGIVSFKADILPKGHPDNEDRVVIFHGKPRPWQQVLVDYPEGENK